MQKFKFHFFFVKRRLHHANKGSIRRRRWNKTGHCSHGRAWLGKQIWKELERQARKWWVEWQMRFWNYKVCLIEDFTLCFIVVESSSLSRSHTSHTEIYCNRKHLRFTFHSMPFQKKKNTTQHRNRFFFSVFFPSIISCLRMCVWLLCVLFSTLFSLYSVFFFFRLLQFWFFI